MAWADLEILEIVFRHRSLGQSLAQVALIAGASRSSVAGHVKRLLDAAGQVEALALTDEEVHSALDAVLGGAGTAQSVACTLSRRRRGPVGRHAVLCLVWQVLDETARAGGSTALRPGHADRVAWPGWWRPVAETGIAA